MKIVRNAAAALLLGVACLVRADADPAAIPSTAATSPSGDSTTPAQAEPQKTDLNKDLLLPDSSHLQIQAPVTAPRSNVDLDAKLNYDGDLPPVEPVQRKPTQGEIEAYLKHQAEAEKNKDWLMRGYEQQLQSQFKQNSDNHGSNLYYELSSDKDLAKLAGLPTLDPSGENPIATPRTGVDDPAKGALVLRKDPSVDKAKPGIPNISAFKPLINPQAPVFGSAVNSPYTSLSYDASQLVPQGNAASTATGANSKTSDVNASRDIEMPGLVAAQSDPLATSTFTDIASGLSQEDPLPQTDHSILEVPPSISVGGDSALLQKNYAKALSIPGSLTITQPRPVNPVIYKIPANSQPVVKVSQPSPVRRPIADPLDIPYH